MMSFKTILVSVAFLLGADQGLAFSTSPSSSSFGRVEALRVSSDDSFLSGPTAGRRVALSKLAGLLTVYSALVGVGLPALADVSDGNALPEGAAQFGRVIRAKADLATISKRVSDGASEMDKTEWNNVGGFLRKVYAVGDDMKSIASGFDAEKKTKAAALIDDLKKYSKAADAPTGSQNGPEFLAYSKKILGIFDEFLDLLSDVPDEL